MSHDSQNFDELRRLLAVKRYEQPPPGYFNQFPREVVARIRAGETGEAAGLLARFFGESSWLQRAWAVFETKPILASAVGAAACILLVGGVFYSESTDPAPTPYATSPFTGTVDLAADRAANSMFVPAALVEFQSTNNFGSAARGSFSGVPVMPVSYTLGN